MSSYKIHFHTDAIPAAGMGFTQITRDPKSNSAKIVEPSPDMASAENGLFVNKAVREHPPEKTLKPICEIPGTNGRHVVYAMLRFLDRTLVLVNDSQTGTNTLRSLWHLGFNNVSS